MKERLRLASCLAAGLALFTICDTTTAAAESDWGYSDQKNEKKVARPAPPQELKAAPAQPLNAIPPSAKPTAAAARRKAAPNTTPHSAAGSAAPQAPTKANPAEVNYFVRSKPPVRSGAAAARPRPAAADETAETQTQTSAGQGDEQAIGDWLEVFNLASKQPLDDDQKARFRSQLQHKLHSNRRQEVLSILKFWPQAAKDIAYGIDQREGFASLFRALLRFESKSKQLSSEDEAILQEVLGAERIALPGDPPLTEDAVDAYADMACFMYEQRHPGKTIDAIDNRTIFASVICQKYTNAPSPAAKKAMANFALSWAKFKIAWADAGPPEREKLLASLEAGTKPPAELNAKIVDTIITGGPWATLKR